MKNLAGVAECDEHIRTELKRARIDIVQDLEPCGREVNASVHGVLPGIVLTRAWYYWVARGPVSLELAERLYADPVGATDVRSGGDCACRPPATWADYFDAAGNKLASDPDGEEEKRWDHFFETGLFTADIKKPRFIRCKREELRQYAARAVVNVFHIDTEVGLRLFADAVREATK